MNARRARLVAALVIALSALPMGTAHAAGTGRVTTPASGAALTSPTPISIEVTGQSGTVLNPQDHVVEVRLADHTGATPVAGTEPVAATCQSNCDGDSTWTVSSFDPATLAPFASGPSCNGGYTVQVKVDGGPWTGNAVRIARAPGAPRDVAVSGGVGEATVTWQPPVDPDVVGYRVERRVGSGSWQKVAQVAPGARSVTDGDVTSGEVAYRVATLRGDGLVGGQPAAPCADDAPDLVTASSAVTTTVRSTSTTSSPTAPSRPSPSDSPSADDGTDGTDGTGGAGGDGTPGGDGGDPADGDGATTTDDGETPTDDGQTDAGTEDGAAAPTRRPGNRVAPPSRVGTVSAPDVSVPGTPAADGPQVATEEERYYGEGQSFSEELDFGDVDELGEVDALGDGPATSRVIRVPGALQSVFGEELAVERILAPIAGGMILLAFGMHLRRWTREGLEG